MKKKFRFLTPALLFAAAAPLGAETDSTETGSLDVRDESFYANLTETDWAATLSSETLAANTPSDNFVAQTPIWTGPTTMEIRALIHVIEAGTKITAKWVNALIGATDGVHAKVEISGSQNEEQTGDGIVFESTGTHKKSEDAGYYSGDDVVTGYYIKDLYPEASNSGYINVKQVVVSSEYEGKDAVCGIFHIQGGNGAQQDFGSVTISEKLEVSYYGENASVAGIWQRGSDTDEPPYIRGDVTINGLAVTASANSGTAYGIFQDGNAHIDGNVKLAGEVAGANAFGIKGGKYGGNIFANLAVAAYNGDAVGIYLDKTAGSILGEETVTTDDNVQYTLLRVDQGGVAPSGNTVGILLDGATVSGKIGNYHLYVTNRSENPDDLAVGFYMTNGASVGSISNLKIDVGSGFGSAAGFVYDNSETKMSVGDTVTYLDVTVTNDYAETGVGRAAAIVIGQDANFAVDKSKLSISTTGNAYGLAYGKNVSGDTDSGGNEADGGVCIFNHTTKDSSGLTITNSEISVYSVSQTARAGSGVYGLYIEGENTYALSGNSFNVTAYDQNAYGVYAAGTSQVSDLTTLTAEGDSSVYGVYATEAATVAVNDVNVSGSGNLYGVYVEKNASVSITGTVNVAETDGSAAALSVGADYAKTVTLNNATLSAAGNGNALLAESDLALVSAGTEAAKISGKINVGKNLRFTQGAFELSSQNITASAWEIGSADASGNVAAANVTLAADTEFSGNALTFYVETPEARATQNAVISVADGATFTALATTVTVVLDYYSGYGVGDVITLIGGDYNLDAVSEVFVRQDGVALNPETYVYGAVAGGWGITFVPEPSAFGLLAGIGALALAVSRRKNRKFFAN